MSAPDGHEGPLCLCELCFVPSRLGTEGSQDFGCHTRSRPITGTQHTSGAISEIRYQMDPLHARPALISRSLIPPLNGLGHIFLRVLRLACMCLP